MPISLLRVRDRDKILASVSFKDLDTAYPFMLACSQQRTEAILLQRLQTFGGAVQRACEVVAINARKNNIEVQ